MLCTYSIYLKTQLLCKVSHKLICGDKSGKSKTKFPSLSQLPCCLSLPICCLNTMLLEAHQLGSVSCYKREVKRLFQLLCYWLRPPCGQARPSVNPARNERRSLPTEKVSLQVCVMCLLALTWQIGSAGGGGCVLSHMSAVCVICSANIFHDCYYLTLIKYLPILHYLSKSELCPTKHQSSFDILFNRAWCPFACQIVVYCIWAVQ